MTASTFTRPHLSQATPRSDLAPKVWHLVQIREGAAIGAECILGKGVYVGEGVLIGSRVKIQNGVSIYPGATVEDGVFIGPHVCFTNDRHPRAINPDGSVQTAGQWEIARFWFARVHPWALRACWSPG